MTLSTQEAHSVDADLLAALREENAQLKAELAQRAALPQEMAASITKLMETERILRRRERDLQSVLDNMPSMIGYWDRALRNRFGNHAYQIWFGIEPSRLPGMHIKDVIGEERYRLNLPHIEAVLRGEPQMFERTIPCPNGNGMRHSLARYIPDIIDGETQGFFVLVSDITEVKNAEAAIIRSNARYDELVRCISVGVYTFRSRTDGAMAFEYLSPRVCALLDLDAEAVLADVDAAFTTVHPEDRQSLIDANHRAVTTLEPFRWEGRFVVRGEPRWILIESAATPGDDGDSLWNGVITDITERKSLEMALRLSNTDLNQFAYVASHDLQTPLRNIISYLQLLERRYAAKLDADARDFIGFAVNGAKQMTALINDLLEYSRIDSQGKAFAPASLGDMLGDALDNLRHAMDEVGAKVEVADQLPTVLGDQIQLRQLLQNLLGNAIKYRRPDCAPRIRITTERAGPYWTIAIADNGIGIDAEFFDRVFAIFQRLHTSARYPGTGIGLALCKRVVDRHGGRIWVESGENGGCVFKFTLPAE